MKIARYNRRNFVKLSLTGMGSILLLPRCAQPQSKWRFFSDNEAKTIEAITEQIIPADEDAGAKEANVINFIDKQLVGYYKNHQEIYRKAVVGVNETSTIMFNKEFIQLTWEAQTSVLKTLESGEAPGDTWKIISSSGFFNLIRDHSMQGFYGSPRHGGNKNYVSYKMLNLDYPYYLGRNKYNLNT
ncbi:MAG: gluconate 2-dehydrogenase subunit 3 family protein [Bacteroidales bacterium]|nr:gluconate 2-dehydrogenase subunit 3 family protein [Bacteroidales bacterium]